MLSGSLLPVIVMVVASIGNLAACLGLFSSADECVSISIDV